MKPDHDQLGVALMGGLVQGDQTLEDSRVDIRRFPEVHNHNRRALDDRKGVNQTLPFREVEFTL